jgi:S1-C subfamily serine protease
MGHKMNLPRFTSSWLIALGVLAWLPFLATELKGQTSSREPSERVSDRAKAGNVRGSLRGMRVRVEIYDPMAGTITGSGFWIGTEGLVVTCWRNVSNNPDGIMIITSEATGAKAKGKLVAQDIQKNLALIQAVPNPFSEASSKSRSANARLKTAAPAPDSPQIGDKLFLAVKRPKQTDFDVQAQPVSAIRPLKELGNELKILLSEVTRFGRSGEPVVDRSGQLVGILEGIYPSLDRARWGSTEIVIPVQPIMDIVKSASAAPPKK